MKKAILFLLFCLLFVALLPELFEIFFKKSSGRPNQNVEKTEVIKYVQISVPHATRSGSCWIESIAAETNDKAWRCFADGNYIYDPCFETEGKQVVCDVTPEKPDGGFVLSLLKGLPNRSQSTRKVRTNWPWIVEFQNGLICEKITGAASMIEEKYVYYNCNENGTVLLGEVDNSTQPWKAEVAHISKDYREIYKSEILPVVRVWE